MITTPALCSPPALVPHPGTVRTAIASLETRDIALMPRADLVDLIRLSQMVPANIDTGAPFEELDDNAVTRLAFLVRRCCRNQLDAHRQQIGQPVLFLGAI